MFQVKFNFTGSIDFHLLSQASGPLLYLPYVLTMQSNWYSVVCFERLSLNTVKYSGNFLCEIIENF